MSKKTIPINRKNQTVDDLLEVIRKGRLDKRTKQAKAVEETKIVLELAPEETMKAMLRHQLSLNHLIERELVRFVVDKQDNLLGEDGRLPDALSKDLLAMQRATLRAMKQLHELEGGRPVKNEKDVHAMVLECATDDD